MACRCACRIGRSACATSISSCSTAWATRACSRWCSPAIRGAPTSPATTRCKRTRSSPRTCSVTRTSRRTTRCSSAARSRWAIESSSRPRRTRARSARAVEQYGQTRVEQVLDAALALEAHIDPFQALRRERYPHYVDATRAARATSRSRSGSTICPAARWPPTRRSSERARRFRRRAGARSAVAHRGVRAGARGVGARHLSGRARGVVLLLSRVRVPDHERGLGFVLACTLAARGGLPAAQRVSRRAQDAFRRRATARGRAAGVARHESRTTSASRSGSRSSRSTASSAHSRSAREDDDFSFVRNHLTQELAEELKLFRYEQTRRRQRARARSRHSRAARDRARAEVQLRRAGGARDAHRERRLARRCTHEHETDGRGLDLDRAERVLDYLHKVWRRPIRLETVDASGSRASCGVVAAALAPRRRAGLERLLEQRVERRLRGLLGLLRRRGRKRFRARLK